jgi:hypothetical protein
MKYFRYILALVLLCQSFSQFASAQMPDSIKIYDGSLAYMNINAYSYVLKKDKENYTLYRTQTETGDIDKKITDSKPISVGTISFEVVNQLVAALDASYPILSLKTFSIDSILIRENQKTLFESVEDPSWTSRQQTYVKKQLANFKNYERAIRTFVCHERGMHSSAWLEAHFYFPGNKIREVKASMNQFGFPWYIDDRRSYNPALPKLLEGFLQPYEGSNKNRLAGVANILKLLAGQVYRDVCMAAMHSKNLDDFNSR